MQRRYYRPVIETSTGPGALRVAGGVAAFSRLEVLARGERPRVVRADEAPAEALARLCAPRRRVAGLSLDNPRIMAVLNVTPDSFSDGGRLLAADDALAAAARFAAEGADMLDVGGESTRPGASPVPVEEELARLRPVLAGLGEAAPGLPVSIDTRKAAVAREALEAGARLFNDVSALTHDPLSLHVAAETGAAVCLMHAQGDPRTMQQAPRYDNVLLDVYDHLETRIAACEAAGIGRERILVDPGIGFGKTVAHNLALLRGLSLLHGLGCGIMVGVSRKGFIGRLSGEKRADRRAPGSAAAALWAVAQGAQVLRVHDVAETAQALAVWRGIAAEGVDETAGAAMQGSEA